MGFERKPDGIRTGFLSGQSKDAHVGKRTKRIVFIPWDKTEGGEWNEKTNQWNKVHDDKFTIVNYDPGTKNQHDLVAISKLESGAIYIRGHGNPGFPYIMANYQPPGYDMVTGIVLPIADACQRLIDSGLDSTYSGVIKFYSCHSGAKLIPQALAEELKKWQSERDDFTFLANTVRGDLDAIGDSDAAKKANLQVQLHSYSERLKKKKPEDKSMARQGADYMRSKGFNRCKFYGYLGPLGSLYEMEVDGDESTYHKKVELEGLNKRPGHLKGKNTCRPSVARIRV